MRESLLMNHNPSTNHPRNEESQVVVGVHSTKSRWNLSLPVSDGLSHLLAFGFPHLQQVRIFHPSQGRFSLGDLPIDDLFAPKAQLLQV